MMGVASISEHLLEEITTTTAVDPKKTKQKLIFFGFLPENLLPSTNILPAEAQHMVNYCVNPNVILMNQTLFSCPSEALEAAFWIAHYQGNQDLAAEIKQTIEKTFPAVVHLPALEAILLRDEGFMPTDESQVYRSYGAARSQKEFQIYRRHLTGLVTYLLKKQWKAGCLNIENLFDLIIQARSLFAIMARGTMKGRVFYEKTNLSTPLYGRYAKYREYAVERGVYNPDSCTGEIVFDKVPLVTYKLTREDLQWSHCKEEHTASVFTFATRSIQDLLSVSKYRDVQMARQFCDLSRVHYFLSFICAYQGGNAFAAEVITQSVARLLRYQLSWKGEMPDCHAFTVSTPDRYALVYQDITEVRTLEGYKLSVDCSEDEMKCLRASLREGNKRALILLLEKNPLLLRFVEEELETKKRPFQIVPQWSLWFFKGLKMVTPTPAVHLAKE